MPPCGALCTAALRADAALGGLPHAAPTQNRQHHHTPRPGRGTRQPPPLPSRARLRSRSGSQHAQCRPPRAPRPQPPPPAGKRPATKPRLTCSPLSTSPSGCRGGGRRAQNHRPVILRHQFPSSPPPPPHSSPHSTRSRNISQIDIPSAPHRIAPHIQYCIRDADGGAAPDKASASQGVSAEASPPRGRDCGHPCSPDPLSARKPHTSPALARRPPQPLSPLSKPTPSSNPARINNLPSPSTPPQPPPPCKLAYARTRVHKVDVDERTPDPRAVVCCSLPSSLSFPTCC